MSNQTQQRQLLAILADRFPAAFPHDPQAVRPVKIGIDQAIRQACLDLEEQVLRHVLGSPLPTPGQSQSLSPRWSAA